MDARVPDVRDVVAVRRRSGPIVPAARGDPAQRGSRVLRSVAARGRVVDRTRRTDPERVAGVPRGIRLGPDLAAAPSRGAVAARPRPLRRRHGSRRVRGGARGLAVGRVPDDREALGAGVRAGMNVYTVEDRYRVRAELIDKAGEDPRIIAGAEIGALAKG